MKMFTNALMRLIWRCQRITRAQYYAHYATFAGALPFC